jgi:hypothetical protein
VNPTISCAVSSGVRATARGEPQRGVAAERVADDVRGLEARVVAWPASGTTAPYLPSGSYL